MDAEQGRAAAKKLAALGIDVAHADPHQPVRGGWTFKTRVVAPFTGAVIPGADFIVDGNALRFADPPLDALPPVPFVACTSKDDLERAVGAALDARVAQLQKISKDAARLRIKAVVDPQRLVATMQLKTDSGTFHLEGSPDGVRCVRVVRGRGPMDIPADVGAVNLAKHEDAADLELHLHGRVPQWSALDEAMKAQAAAEAPDAFGGSSNNAGTPAMTPSPMPARALTPQPRPAPAGLDALLGAPEAAVMGVAMGGPAPSAAPVALAVAAVEHTPPSMRAAVPAPVAHASASAGPARLTLATLIEKLGATAALVGPAVVVDGVGQSGAWRLRLAHRQGTELDGTLTVGGAPVWEGAVDLAGVASAQVLVASILGVTGARAAVAPSAPALKPGAAWATLICVDQNDGQWVWFTYSGADGRGVGAPTQVARGDFERAFAYIGDDWFLRVIVQSADEQRVTYIACDAAGQPTGGARDISRAEFTALFRPL